MSADLTPEDRYRIEGILVRLENGWNAMDGAAFAAPFAEDADFVTIRGEHMRGRTTIAAGHAGIFRTIYAASVIRCTVLHPEVALVHAHSVLDAPQGPLAGPHRALFSMVLTKASGRWEIAAFHNTVESGSGPST